MEILPYMPKIKPECGVVMEYTALLPSKRLGVGIFPGLSNEPFRSLEYGENSHRPFAWTPVP
jgi:hypothetical protein